MEEGLGQNSVPPRGYIDKSRILDIKPLRSLIPIYSMSSQTPPAGQYPSGFSPFFPFGAPQQTPTGVTTRGAATPAPLRVYRSPVGAGDTSSTMEGFSNQDTSGKKKRGRPKSSGNKPKKIQEPPPDLSALVGISPSQREDGNREVVNIVLMAFDALRRRLCQLEEAKELSSGSIKRADLKACNTLMTRGIRTNTRKRIGLVPGVEIGDIFFFRMELCIVGLHSPSMGGIDALHIRGELEEETLAVCIVSSGEYGDDAEDNDVLIYTGQGGNFYMNKDKQVTDQKLQRGNLALDRSSRTHNEVRVIRGMRDSVNPNNKIYVYDGLYKIQDSWIEKAKGGGGVFKYKLVRNPGQPSAFAIWKSIQKWKSSGSASRTGLILADLSKGAEGIPVSLVNDVDNVKAPNFFNYFHSLRHSKSFSLMQPSHGCTCTKACVPGDLNCSCIRRNEGDFPYTGNGILVSRKPLVHECGPTCLCFPNCKNRVSQTGLKHPMEVFKTKGRGWGLRSLDPIRAGTFICEYAGEVVERAKLSQLVREGDEYIFDTTRTLDQFKWNYEPRLLEEVGPYDSTEEYAMPYPLVITAKNIGNVARFMNHSCSPNVFWQPVVYEENNQSYLHVAFFALRHIPPMTELTYDYGFADDANGGSAAKGRKKCLCRSSKCHGSFG